MNFNYERSLENGVFKTVIKFDSFGYKDMTEEAEQKIFTDLGYPVLDVGSGPSEYEGYFKVENGSVIMQATQGADTQCVKLIMNSKKYTIDSSFELSYEIDSNKINDAINDSDILNTKLKVAEAKCVLFEKNMTRKITEAIKAIKNQATNFEEDVPDSFGA